MKDYSTYKAFSCFIESNSGISRINDITDLTKSNVMPEYIKDKKLASKYKKLVSEIEKANKTANELRELFYQL